MRSSRSARSSIALPVVFATPLANLATHGNPYYPVRMSLARPRAARAPRTPTPRRRLGSQRAPRPVRFACSLLEIGIRPLSDEHRWTVDQWMPDDSGGNRMGGFFGAYVVVNLALLVWRACARSLARGARRGDRVRRATALIVSVHAAVARASLLHVPG